MINRAHDQSPTSTPHVRQLDILVVGAGFAGMYMIYRARELGLRVLAVDRAGDVGGTWYWNRYPGARCDVTSLDYSYSFSEELQQEWRWSEKYATQPEILAYARHVADRFSLREMIEFNTSVTKAHYDEQAARWDITTDGKDRLVAQFLVLATGCLSAANIPEITGISTFGGRVLHTASWPHENVDVSDRRVGVIGTGSSGVQSIPILAEHASHMYVFQRTANYSLPAHNHPFDQNAVEEWKRNYRGYREIAKYSRNGIPMKRPEKSTFDVSDSERTATFEEAYDSGQFARLENTYNDIMTSKAANDLVSDFVRSNIMKKVSDPSVGRKLLPRMPFATKRVCLDTGYFETFNRGNVTLVDVKENPIREITYEGVVAGSNTYEIDDLVFATGFDAMTGAVLRMDIRGRGGQTLTEAWSGGPRTYLGLTTTGFPNCFFITGPGSPSVLSNMMVSIEQHVDWIADLVTFMESRQFASVDAHGKDQEAWVGHVASVARETLYPEADSWYLGANIPGKTRVFMPYVGGVGSYRRRCDEVVRQGYCGFVFDDELYSEPSDPDRIYGEADPANSDGEVQTRDGGEGMRSNG